MNVKELKEKMKEHFDKRLAIVDAKSHDYAIDEDVLHNFKRNALLAIVFDINVKNPDDVSFYEFIKKIDRERNLRKKNVKPKNEGREDTRMDLNNYCDYYYELVSEGNSLEQLIKSVLGFEVKKELKKID